MENKIFYIYFLLLLFLPSCKQSCARKKDDTVLKVISSAIPHAEMLEHIESDLKKLGINLEIIISDDYNLPNRSLAEGEVDANFFQHLPYLNEQIKHFHYPIVDFAHVEIEPMGLYSKKHQSVAELLPHARIALPNDPSNESRALVLLAQVGLLKLKNSANASLLDIVENPKNLKFVEVDAAMLPRTLHEVDAAVINANFALQAGLNPLKDALAIEDKQSSYVNILAIRKGDENRPALVELKKALHSEKMREFIKQKYHGAVLPAF